MAELSTLYHPIASHVEAAERVFRDELISDQAFISDLCEHVAHFQGKRLRPALLLLSAQACGGVQPAHHVLAAVVEMVHLATLVHDDVLDEADVRRRTATVNRLWGNERAVLLGDFLISHAFHLCSALDSQHASRLIGAVTNTVCEGEMMQVANRYNYDLTEALYYDIITRKTASLIGVCGRLGALYAGADDDTVRRLEAFGTSLGIAFQITDDVLDLFGDEGQVGKTLGRDLDEGKLTLPLIHYLTQAGDGERQRLIDLIESRDPRKHHEVARLLRQTPSMRYARAAAEGHVHEALSMLDGLTESEARTSLTAMATFVLSRQR